MWDWGSIDGVSVDMNLYIYDDWNVKELHGVEVFICSAVTALVVTAVGWLEMTEFCTPEGVRLVTVVIVGGLAELVGRFKVTLSVILHHLQIIVVGLFVAVENAATVGYMSCFCKGV